MIPASLAFSTVQTAPTPVTNGLALGVRVFAFSEYDNRQDADFGKGTVGLRGDTFIPEWRYDLTASLSKADANYTSDLFLTDRVNNSLSGCIVPTANLISGGTCIVAPALTPALVGGVYPQDWFNYITQPVTGNTTFDESIFTLNLDGPVFMLPAGEVKASVGAEYRKQKIDDTPDANSIAGNLYNFTGAVPTRGSDSVWEAYGEIEIPILANLPLAKALTLNVSGRHTDYESYGEGDTYKFGVLYTPFDWISLRGTYGTSFRAPALFEQYQGATTGFLSSTGDPCNNYAAQPVTSPRYINCHSELNNPNFIATSSITSITAGGAAAGLAAETSKNFGFGFIVQPNLPDAYGDIALAVDYYDIRVEDEVAQVGTAALLSLCYNDVAFRAGGSYCNYVQPRTAGTNALTVLNGFTNIATQVVRGIDYNARYTRDLGPGVIRANVLVTQFIEEASKVFKTDPFNNPTGTINHPEYTGTLDLTYTQGKWKTRYGLEWLGPQNSYGYSVAATTANPSVFRLKVEDYFLSHASIQYTEGADWQATVGVRNVFDTDPPMISAAAGYNRVGNSPLYSGYDYVGRQIFFTLTKKL